MYRQDPPIGRGEDILYTLHVQRMSDDILAVFGQSDKARERQNGVWKPDRFTAVFNTGSEDGSLVTGSGTGTDGGGQPTSGPILFSREPLTADRLRAVVRGAPRQFFPGTRVMSWEESDRTSEA